MLSRSPLGVSASSDATNPPRLLALMAIFAFTSSLGSDGLRESGTVLLQKSILRLMVDSQGASSQSGLALGGIALAAPRRGVELLRVGSVGRHHLRAG